MELIRRAWGVMAYHTVVRNSMHAVCAMAMAQLAPTSWKLNRKPSQAAILMFWYLVLVLILEITHYVCYTTTLAEKWSSTQQVLQTLDVGLSIQTMRKTALLSRHPLHPPPSSAPALYSTLVKGIWVYINSVSSSWYNVLFSSPFCWNGDEYYCPRRDFAQKAKSRRGTLVTRAYIKESTYNWNIQSYNQYRKYFDLLEQEPRGIGR